MNCTALDWLRSAHDEAVGSVRRYDRQQLLTLVTDAELTQARVEYRLFLLLPFLVWLFDVSVSSEMSYERFTALFSAGALGLPGALWKLVALGLVFAYMIHFFAGVRHIWMDMTHSVSKEQGRSSAIVTLVLSVLLTVALGAKLFGLF